MEWKRFPHYWPFLRGIHLRWQLTRHQHWFRQWLHTKQAKGHYSNQWCISTMSNDHQDILIHLLLDCLYSSVRRLTSNENQNSASLALCGGNPPVTDGFPSQRASNAESVSIPWRHHEPVRWCMYMYRLVFDVWKISSVSFGLPCINARSIHKWPLLYDYTNLVYLWPL